MPGDHKQGGPTRCDEAADWVPPGTNSISLPHGGDPRPVGDLVAAWVGVRMAEVDDLVAEARRKVELLPDQGTLWLVIGELVVRLACVEHELAELRKAARR